MAITLNFQHTFKSKDREQFRLNVQASLPPKGLTVVFGESGSGKTSLLRFIAGLDKAENGHIEVNGTTWQNHNAFVPTHKRSLAYVFQEPSLFEHLNIKKNLEFGSVRLKKASNPDLKNDLIELLGIGKLLNRHPDSLSGGEKQRVAICRALLRQPEFLLMDEPLSALDSKRKQEILPYIEKLKSELEIPIIYITHSINEVIRLADHVLMLENGHLKHSGTLSETIHDTDYLIESESEPSVILEGKTGQIDDTWQLAEISLQTAKLYVPADQVNTSHNIRVRIMAKDVSIALSDHNDTSIQNRIAGDIVSIEEDDRHNSLVKIAIGSDFILAKLTRRSVHQLGLELGKVVYAQIKSVAIVH